jgi:hypothetical protein
MWSMNLDNRPSSIVVQDVPEELRGSSELTTHFASFGTVVSSNQDGNYCTVQFSNRREAETAMARGRVLGAHTLKLAWPSSTASKASVEQSGTAGDAGVAESRLAEEPGAAEDQGVTDVTAGQETTADSAAAGEYTRYAEEPEDEDRSWKRQ